MKPNAFPKTRPAAAWILGLAVSASFGLDGKDLGFGAAGWMQYGQIAKSTDTAGGFDHDGRASLSTGAQIALRPKISERLSIAAGVGVAAGHALPGQMEAQFAGGSAPMLLSPYVAEANFTYSILDGEASQLFVRGGLFPYDYAPDAQNLGLYLTRGPVYPGLLLSGFETKYVLPVANTMGLQLRHEIGGFRQDLLLMVETEFYPFYDLSPAYVASYGFGSAFRIGAGVNFYHLITMDQNLMEDPSLPGMIYQDSVAPAGFSGQTVYDTTVLAFRGTKIMGHFSLDPKALIGAENGILGPEDLKLYGEIALIGLPGDQPSEQRPARDSTGTIVGPIKLTPPQVYEKLFGKASNRMPVMVGFNLPAFRLLDRLGLEIEWYGAKFKDDLAPYNHFRGNHPQPKPLHADTNYARDNLKWSFYGSRMLNRNVKLSFQVASDHYRPGVWVGYGDNKPASSQVLFRGPSEWYWMTKIAYFF
jgi:hypothetical protein